MCFEKDMVKDDRAGMGFFFFVANTLAMLRARPREATYS